MIQSTSPDRLGTSYFDSIKILEKGYFYENGDIIKIDLRENKIARFFTKPPLSISSCLKSYNTENIDDTIYQSVPYKSPNHDNTPKYNQFSPLYLIKDNNDRFFTSFVMIEIANKTKLENIYISSRTPMISLFKTRDYPPVSTTDFKPPRYRDFNFIVPDSGNLKVPPTIPRLPSNFKYLPDLILKNTDISGNINARERILRI